MLWTRDRSPEGVRDDRWFVSKPERRPCGGVWREAGRYRAEAWPAGGTATPGAYYASRAQAQRHLERWLLAHPRVLALEAKVSRGTKSTSPPPMDWRLAQYLRLGGMSLYAPRVPAMASSDAPAPPRLISGW